jgi:hypothetical protein
LAKKKREEEELAKKVMAGVAAKEAARELQPSISATKPFTV